MKYNLKWYLTNVNIMQYVKLNYFSSNLQRDKNVFFYPMKGTKLDIDRTARIELHGDLYFGNNLFKGSKRETYLKLMKDSLFVINGEVKINYGAFLQAHPNSVIQIGKSVINTDSVIIAQKEIKIGNDVLMGRMVTIFDSDFHPIYDENGIRSNPPRKVEIGDHVWIGIKATILKGTKIKEGAVISANALVGGIVKANTMYGTLPGQSFGMVSWGKKKGKGGEVTV